MTLAIGPTIARLRREMGATQEQLAAAVGVTAPAVSKWETGQSYPDITLVAPIARFLDTTTDVLLAYTPRLTDEATGLLLDELRDAFALADFATGMARCRDLLLEYPRDAKLRLALHAALMEGGVFARTDAERDALRALQLEILVQAAETAEGETLPMAKYMLGTAYMRARRLDEADAVFDAFPRMPPDPATLLPTLRQLQGRLNDAERQGQANLLESAMNAANALAALARIAAQAGDAARAARYADAAEATLAPLGLVERLGMTVAAARLTAAHALGDREALLRAAELSATACLAHPDRLADLPLFDRMPGDDREGTPAAREQARALRNLAADHLLAQEAYAPIRDDPRFALLIDRLRRE